MTEAPNESDITNVFALNDPKHMFNKLAWELTSLMQASSVWTDNHGQPISIYAALNTAVTAWHISDWLWHSSPEVREKLKKRFKLRFDEGTKNQMKVGLERFQDALAEECRPLAICREIAKGVKHMRIDKIDPKIRALVEWVPAVQAAGLVKLGDLIPSIKIVDHGKSTDAILCFIEAFGFWERLFVDDKIVSDAPHVPDIIRAEQQAQPVARN